MHMELIRHLQLKESDTIAGERVLGKLLLTVKLQGQEGEPWNQKLALTGPMQHTLIAKALGKFKRKIKSIRLN